MTGAERTDWYDAWERALAVALKHAMGPVERANIREEFLAALVECMKVASDPLVEGEALALLGGKP